MDVSARDLADILGVSDRLVRELAARGLAIRASRGRYRLVESVRRYAEHLRSVAAGRGGDEAQFDLTVERARLAKEQADERSMKNAVMRRELLPADEVERSWADILRRTRSAMLAVTSRVRQRAPGMDAALADVIDREIRDALTELADGNSGCGGQRPGGDEAPAAHEAVDMDGTGDAPAG